MTTMSPSFRYPSVSRDCIACGIESNDNMEACPMKKNSEITIRSSAAEYLTFVASTGDSAESIEMRYENENI